MWREMNKEELLNQIKILEAWFVENKYHGYDPYDLFDTRLFHYLIDIKYVILRKINRKFISWFIFLFPSFVIKIFNKKPNINAKAMGLLLKAHCNLYETTKDRLYLDKAFYLAEWLINNRSTNIKGYGWGYPFDWSGSKFIPKNTPSSVVSTVVGDGLYALYTITNDKKYLEACQNICVFLVEDLNIDYVSDNEVCFSYTPIDKDHVVNANLFSAEYLVRIGKELANSKYIDCGIKALNYVLAQQKDNGEFLYWGEEDKKRLRYSLSNSDHYHTGFELRMLASLSKMLNYEKAKKALNKYYRFYLSSFINDDYSINLFPHKKYPINIHACSEVLICNSALHEFFIDQSPDLNKIYKWIEDNMRDRDGLFIYEIRKLLGLKLKHKFKYHRWAQAWMFLALSEYYKFE